MPGRGPSHRQGIEIALHFRESQQLHSQSHFPMKYTKIFHNFQVQEQRGITEAGLLLGRRRDDPFVHQKLDLSFGTPDYLRGALIELIAAQL